MKQWKQQSPKTDVFKFQSLFSVNFLNIALRCEINRSHVTEWLYCRLQSITRPAGAVFWKHKLSRVQICLPRRLFGLHQSPESRLLHRLRHVCTIRAIYDQPSLLAPLGEIRADFAGPKTRTGTEASCNTMTLKSASHH